MIPLPTQKPLDPKVHFNTSIELLNIKGGGRKRPQVIRKEVLYRECDVPERFKEQLKKQETKVPISYIDSLKKLLEEKSLILRGEEQDEGLNNVFEEAEWKNARLAGLVLGMEDYVKLEESRKGATTEGGGKKGILNPIGIEDEAGTEDEELDFRKLTA